MLDYSKTDRPVGRYNDSTGIDRHSSANTASVEKWKSMVDDRQSLHFARCYLEALGENTISRLGYDYQEIFNALHGSTLSTKNLYPWSLAIQPESKWTFRQRVVSDYYFSRRSHGWVKGALLTSIRHLKIIARKFLKAISSPENI